MESFHINFVNLSTLQLLTQKVHGCLYEKLHFNFNIPQIFKRDIFDFVILGILKNSGKKLGEIVGKEDEFECDLKKNGLIFYCLSTTNDKVLKMSINQRRAQNASIYDGSSS